jgi:hypothetical protein
MAYAQGPYEDFPAMPSPDTTVVVASRKIDYGTGRYSIDDDGNPEGMDPTAQRVILSVAFDAQPAVSIVTDEELEARSARIVAALQPMVVEGAIRDVSVLVEDRGGGEVFEQIDFYNVSTAKADSVTSTS